MDQGQAMQVDHDGLSAIVEASETHVNHLYENRGTSIDLYKFRKYSNQQGWKHGHIFHGSNREDLSFEGGMIQDIKARDDTNTREAMFLVQEANQWVSVEDTMVRSSTTLNHIGILKPFVGGFNTQISEVVCGFTSINSSLTNWLTSKQPSDKRTSIPVEVQQLIRTAYLAIEKIWSAGSTSVELANPASYHMIDDRIKIDPLRTRTRLAGENNMRPLRVAFGEMIKNAIHSRWEDDELLDFIDLLGYQTVGVGDVLGHPVLLSPHRRQLMYHKFHSEIPTDNQINWLRANADPGANWKQVASNSDPTLKSIIAYQVRQVMRPSIMSSSDDDLVQHPRGFSLNVFGALHFSSVVTAHYHQHFKRFTQGNWREEIIGRVDLQLKTVLPRLLTKRYNAKFIR